MIFRCCWFSKMNRKSFTSPQKNLQFRFAGLRWRNGEECLSFFAEFSIFPRISQPPRLTWKENCKMEQQKGLHSKPLLRCLTHAIVTCLNIFKFSVQIIFYAASQERKQGCKTQMQNFLPVFFFFCFVLATIWRIVGWHCALRLLELKQMLWLLQKLRPMPLPKTEADSRTEVNTGTET